MNNSSVNTEDLVQSINAEKVRQLTPAIVYISILMAMGLVGNLMVCFYYGFKTKMVHTSVFILTVATYYLIVCTITMPAEITDLVRFYTFEKGEACKFLRFVNHFAVIASLLTLVAIAIDRYKHICGALLNKMKLKDAMKYCVIVAGVAIFLAWPSLLIYDSVKVPVPNKFGINLQGSDCTSTKAESYIPFVWTVNVIHLLVFVISSTILVVLYSKVWQAIYINTKRMGNYKLNSIALTSTNDTSSAQPGEETQTSIISEYDNTGNTSEQTDNTKPGDKENRIENMEATDHEKHKVEVESTQSTKKTTPKPPKIKRHIDNETAKFTVMMFVITAVFFVSCIPYFSLTIWRSFEGKHEGVFLTDARLVGFEIGMRSYLVNSSLNPWIYGIFNSRFRQYYYRMLCCNSRR